MKYFAIRIFNSVENEYGYYDFNYKIVRPSDEVLSVEKDYDKVLEVFNYIVDLINNRKTYFGYTYAELIELNGDVVIKCV